jgi:hypothetical protein
LEVLKITGAENSWFGKKKEAMRAELINIIS